MELLLNGFVSVLQPQIFFVLVAGTLGGIIIGSLPGLTATMGVALLTPLKTFAPLDTFRRGDNHLSDQIGLAKAA